VAGLFRRLDADAQGRLAAPLLHAAAGGEPAPLVQISSPSPPSLSPTPAIDRWTLAAALGALRREVGPVAKPSGAPVSDRPTAGGLACLGRVSGRPGARSSGTGCRGR
jgi:hypothetical protein